MLRLERRRGVRGRARLHAVDADDPVLRGERLLEVLQMDVLLLGVKKRESVYADHGATVDVVARLLVVVETDLAEAVVGEAVEKRVPHGGRGVGVDSVLPGVEEVGLLDVVGIDARRDADHPEEFVDVVAAVADESAENNEHVVHIETAENRVGLLLGRGERLRVRNERNQGKYATNGGDVRVVPGVIVHDDGAVAHTGHLVAVVPPGHELGVLVGVHAHPVVRFAVIVEDRARAVAILRGCALEEGKKKATDDDGGRGVRFRGNEAAVHRVEDQTRVDHEQNAHDRRGGERRELCMSSLASIPHSFSPCSPPHPGRHSEDTP